MTELLIWQRKGRRVTMRRDGTWFDILGDEPAPCQPQFYTIAGVSIFDMTTMLSFAEIPGRYVFRADEFRPVEPLGIADGMAMLREIMEPERSETMAITLGEFEGWA